MGSVRPHVAKQMRTGKRFTGFAMLVSAILLIGTLAEYLRGWDEQPDLRTMIGAGGFMVVSAGLFFGLNCALARMDQGK